MLCQAQAASGGVDVQPWSDTAIGSNTGGWASKSEQAASMTKSDDCAFQRMAEDYMQHLMRLPHQCNAPTDEQFRWTSPSLRKSFDVVGRCVWNSTQDISKPFPWVTDA